MCEGTVAFSVSFTSRTSPPSGSPASTAGPPTAAVGTPRPVSSPGLPARWAAPGWRWGPRSRRTTTAVAAAVLSVAVAALTRAALGPSAAVPWLGGLAVATLAAGVLGGRRGNHTLGAALLLTGGAAAGLTVEAAAVAQGWPVAAWTAAGAAVLAGTCALLGLCTAVGRAGYAGALAVTGAALLWQALALLPADLGTPDGRSRLGAAAVVAGVLVLGVLPRLALVRAGLTGPGARPSGGAADAPADGPWQVDAARATAHAEVVAATVVCAASTGAGGWLLLEAPGPWTVGLTLLTVGMLLARAWAYPLVVEVVALLAAATVPLLRLFAVWVAAAGDHPYAPLLVLGALAAAPFVLLAVDVPAHAYRGWPARAAQRAEVVGAVLLVPVALGASGVYTPLLDAF